MARSAQMRLIRAEDTKPELRVRKHLHALGLRFRLHARGLPGRPDIVFSSRRLVIFVHGCFWHRHKNCSKARLPRSRLDYWLPKLERNVSRDREHVRELKKLGWRVMTIWECQTSRPWKLESLGRAIDACKDRA